MSRSKRKTPITANASNTSEKKDKRIWHGRMRAHTRDVLTHANDESFDDSKLPCVLDVSNAWDMSKDGKHYFSPTSQLKWAEWEANRNIHANKSKTEKERIKKRELHRNMSK